MPNRKSATCTENSANKSNYLVVGKDENCSKDIFHIKTWWEIAAKNVSFSSFVFAMNLEAGWVPLYLYKDKKWGGRFQGREIECPY